MFVSVEYLESIDVHPEVTFSATTSQIFNVLNIFHMYKMYERMCKINVFPVSIDIRVLSLSQRPNIVVNNKRLLD